MPACDSSALITVPNVPGGIWYRRAGKVAIWSEDGTAAVGSVAFSFAWTTLPLPAAL
jgi:hypothetical protein